MAKTTQLSDAFKAVGESMVKLGKLLAEKEANAEAATSKKRVKRDANAPKKNYSSYLHYCSLHRERVMKANPGLGQPAVAKLLGEEWNKLTEAEKDPYKKSADADKERYDKEMATYTPGAAAAAAAPEEEEEEEEEPEQVAPPAKKKKSRAAAKPKATAPVAEVTEAPATTESEGDEEEKKAAEKKAEKEAKKAKKAKKNKKEKK